MISRRTIIFLLIAVTFFGVLAYRGWEQQRPCREWQHNHAKDQAEPPPVKQPDGGIEVSFNPCYIWSETPLIDKILALTGLAAGVASIVSLLQDVTRWLRKKRAIRRARTQ
jgi:hypothetical protein